MMLTRDDFGAFFAELHDGHRPFDWQNRLLDQVLSDGWPDAIVAPTGAGKTAAIDVHVFAQALAATAGMPAPPRRLAMIVGRRVLVDDQHTHARRLAVALVSPAGDLMRAVARGLWSMRGGDADGASPLLVARLRGGEPAARRWVDHPAAAAVICATPEMWGSRVLFRGYGSSSRSWPREAGLLAFDTVAVVDEAHLARQLLCTARRVGELVTVADRVWAGPSPLHVVETTATPGDEDGRRIGVEDTDLVDGSTLRERLCRPKPITLVPRKDWAQTRPRPFVVDEIARQALNLLDRDNGEPRTVGCFVNTVARAVALTAALQDERITGRKLTVVMLCGQVRQIDIARLAREYPGLLSPRGNPDVDVLVSTQTLEVGVDLDLASVVTELADASAIIQRAGRVNRRGLRADGPVAVIVPIDPIRSDARSGPYESTGLAEAWEWLIERAADPDGLAPWALRSHRLPEARRRRTLLQRPELGQAWHWARTSDDLAADPELDLWLSDDLEPETSVGLVVRADLPVDVPEAVELIKLLRPRRHETFGVPIGTAIEALFAARQALRRADRDADLLAVRARGDDVAPLDWTETVGGDARPRIRPGDVVVIDGSTALFTASSSGGHRSPPVVVPGGDETRRHVADDVLEATAELHGGPRVGEIVHRIDLAADRVTPTGAEGALAEKKYRELVDDLVPVDPDARGEIDERAVVQAWLEDTDRGPMAAAAADLLRTGPPEKVDVVVQRSEDGVPLRVVVVDGRRATADEYVRQEWTPSRRPVTLDDHQSAVADRAVTIAQQVGIPDDLVAVLRTAALHHDDGKADSRFQTRLGAAASPHILAKSRDFPSPEVVRRRIDRSGLPPGWRHEQRSVVEAEAVLEPDADRDLALRLIGTTHGHGRSSFPHTTADLLDAYASPKARRHSERLFDEGRWDELIERTHLRHGVWVCAYLEALLRAADGQISGEGR